MITVHWQTVSSVNVLKSTPPSVNGVLTACAGQHISLTCSHNNLNAGNTIWRSGSPVDCLRTFSHASGSAPPSPCGPFTFQGITPLLDASSVLNSTAVASATVDMNNATIECRSGNLDVISIGNITLCIVGELCGTNTLYMHAGRYSNGMT